VFNAGQQLFEGVIVKPGDLKVTIANTTSLTLEPAAGHYLWFPQEDTTLADVRYTIKAVQRQWGGDNVYAFVCLVRR
jgi:hypothetical protein